METAETVVKSALQEILVQASEAPLEASEYQDGIQYLNRMMDSFAVDGISLGYTAVSDLGDQITVPNGAINAMVKNLAIQLYPQFSVPGKPIDPLLLKQSEDGMKTLRALSISAIGPSLYPGTLPIGSGNECNGQYTDHFYTEEDDPVLSEGGGFISVESETEI